MYYDNPQMEFDSEIIRGFYASMNKLVGDLQVEQKIMMELHTYKVAGELFGTELAIAMRKKVSPAQWWRLYGSSTPNLQQLAIKILSLTCSSSGCERNWSVFEQIHTKRRNRLDHKKLHDLVYVKYNQALMRRYNLKDEVDPISLNDIDECNEWLVGEMDGDDDDEVEALDERVFGGNDPLTWNQVYDVSGVGEPLMYTRRNKRKQPPSGEGASSKKQQLKDYGTELNKIPLRCDRKSAINLSKNPILHSKTKHIEIRHHFLRDHVQKNDCVVEFVETNKQLADIFIKPLPKERFNQLRIELGIINEFCLN
uniref:Copia protein n=1 Tax=Cajanus cajan TaxID=3821 RepID=A0A151SWU1_CAJCA|nr:Copia protein [Cajanus cajan]